MPGTMILLPWDISWVYTASCPISKEILRTSESAAKKKRSQTNHEKCWRYARILIFLRFLIWNKVMLDFFEHSKLIDSNLIVSPQAVAHPWCSQHSDCADGQFCSLSSCFNYPCLICKPCALCTCNQVASDKVCPVSKCYGPAFPLYFVFITIMQKRHLP